MSRGGATPVPLPAPHHPELDRDHARVDHVDPARGAPGEVDDAPLRERASIVDDDAYAFPTWTFPTHAGPRIDPGDLHHGAEVPFLFGTWIKLCCETEHDFVTTNLASYVSTLHNAFLTRFPEAEAEITRCIRASTDVFGADLFGPAAHDAAMALDRRLEERVMAQFHAGAEFVRR